MPFFYDGTVYLDYEDSLPVEEIVLQPTEKLEHIKRMSDEELGLLREDIHAALDSDSLDTHAVDALYDELNAIRNELHLRMEHFEEDWD